MKINTNVYKQYVKSGGSGRCPNFTLSSAGKAAASKKDSFSLSSEASMFRECGKTIRSAVSEITSPAGEDRISSLRQQIKDGSYDVSSDRIADAILERVV